jgi:hypothetical protein
VRKMGIVDSSVAEPEPVERQLFAGAGAKFFGPSSGSGAGYVNSDKMLQMLQFTLSNLLMIFDHL